MKLCSILTAGIVALAGLAATTPSRAKTFTVGEPAVAVVTLPNRWKANEYESGVEATAPNRGAYVAVEAVKIADVETATREGILYFQKQGIKIDQASMEKRDTTIAGLPAVGMMWRGRDGDGPTNVGMTFVVLNDKQSVLLYIWASDDQMRASNAELKAIADSLKPVGG